MLKIPFPTIETKFHRCLILDSDFHVKLSGYLKQTGRDYISLRENLHISCDYYIQEEVLFKIFITRLGDCKPNIIKMGNVIMFSDKGFTILPMEAFKTLFEVK